MQSQTSWQGRKVRYCKPQKQDEVLFPTVADDLGEFVSLSSGNRKSLYRKLVALSELTDCPLASFIGESQYSELVDIKKSRLKRHAIQWLVAQANDVPLLQVDYRRQIVAFGALQQVDKSTSLGYRDFVPKEQDARATVAQLAGVVQIPDNLS